MLDSRPSDGGGLLFAGSAMLVHLLVAEKRYTHQCGYDGIAIDTVQGGLSSG